MSFWIENKNTIMNGRLTAKSPEANYSMVKSELNAEVVAAAYSERVLEMDRPVKKISFINGTHSQKLYVDSNTDKALYKSIVYNCMGEIVENSDIILNIGINEFAVPVSGRLFLLRIQ